MSEQVFPLSALYLLILACVGTHFSFAVSYVPSLAAHLLLMCLTHIGGMAAIFPVLTCICGEHIGII